MVSDRDRTGAGGERVAERFLKRNGYRVVERNCRSKWGEIDLIMRDRDTVVFVEVKTRTSDEWGLPEDAVTPGKQKRLTRQATLFATQNRLQGYALRFDVIAVLMLDGGYAEVRHFPDAFTPR